MHNKLFRLALLALALALTAHPALAEWGNSRGGPERDGARVGVADLTDAEIAWRHPIGGELSAASLLSLELGGEPRLALAAAGRLRLVGWDDSPVWSGNLDGATQIAGVMDIDGDGVIDLLIAPGSRGGPALVGYTPDGVAAFAAPDGVLGPVSSGIRVADLDGDGRLDLYATPVRGDLYGPQGAAFRFPDGPGSGELMYVLDASDRDYFGGFYDVVAELDGSPGLEIMALGRNHVYLYDAATGALESTSEDLGPIPFARATLRLVDVDGDGTSEVFAFSNQAWSPPNDSRHVTLLAYDGSAMAPVWRRQVDDVVADQVSFSDSSVVDLDGDGALEVAFGIYDGGAGTWSTEIRDAAGGELLDRIDGERYEDAVAGAPGGGALLLTHAAGQPLRAYRFDRTAGVRRVGEAGDLEPVRCVVRTREVREAPRRVPCRVPISGVAGRGFLAGERQGGSGPFVAVAALDVDGGLTPVGRIEGGENSFSGAVELAGGHAAAVALARSDGVVLPLDATLQPVPPTAEPPDIFSGVRYGTAFSGSDVAPFPLVVANPDGAAERVLAGSGGRALLLDASADPSNSGGARVVWARTGANRAVAVGGDDPSVVLFDSRDGVTSVGAGDGAIRWHDGGLFDPDAGIGLHGDPLLVRRAPPDNQIWFHRRAVGTYDLTVLDAASGAVLATQPSLDVNDGGWKRLSLAAFSGQTSPLSGRLGQVWRFDIDGSVAQVLDAPAGFITIPVRREGAEPLLLVRGARSLSAFDPSLGETLWTVDDLPTFPSRPLGALLRVEGHPKYATGVAGSAELRIIDVETGSIDFSGELAGGEVRAPGDPLASGFELSNVTAVTDLTGDGEPAYLVGSSDGFVYAVNAGDFSLRWALDAGAPVGEIVPADWDGDGRLELAASTPGAIIGIDRFTGAAPAWVVDTDGQSLEDIDRTRARERLHAAWAAVPDATSYRVAVFTNDGVAVTRGFRDVGRRTQITIAGLSLEVGRRYVVAVRAVSDRGVSSDTASDGVTVIASTVDDGGCCQVAGDGDRGLSALLLALACVALTRRRRAR